MSLDACPVGWITLRGVLRAELALGHQKETVRRFKSLGPLIGATGVSRAELGF